jgi:hypothetical protein
MHHWFHATDGNGSVIRLIRSQAVYPFNKRLKHLLRPLWKYVDDSTTSEIVSKNGTSKAQDLVDEVIYWSDENKMQLNADKCK